MLRKLEQPPWNNKGEFTKRSNVNKKNEQKGMAQRDHGTDYE